MKNVTRIATALMLLFSLSACVTFLEATNKKPIESNPGKRTFGEYMDDERLETIIAVNLRKIHPELADAHINVYCFNGVVLLTGEVPSRDLRQLAGETVRDVHKVRQVHNELLVKSNSTFFSRANDDWISTKIRTRLITHKEIESERVKVIVENRIVYIMGLLTQDEATMVSELAAKVSGVEKVVRVVEYIQM